MRLSALDVLAPAKINLVLEILGRRDDGFHALETVFQAVALFDQLRVQLEPGDGIALTCNDPTLPIDEGNLAWRAAAAMQRARPGCGRCTIALTKHIPHGAGLGGGSSDAAAVLRALNRLLPQPLPHDALAVLAAELGSDVPFFLFGGTAHATGRGEVLTALPDLPRTAVTICKPAEALPTPAVFRALTDAERGPRSARGASAWHDALSRDLAGLLSNRLTAPARRLSPAVAALLDHFAARKLPALLSGSGSACFVLGHVTAPTDVQTWQTWFYARE